MKIPGVWWMVTLLSVASFAAASDLRLVEATEKGDKETVRSLLKQHADVNTPQADGATALAWAVHWGDLETTELLIGAGANVNAANAYGVTPLSLACANGSAAIVDKLLKAGAGPNAAASGGQTALMECARTGNLDAVKLLLAKGATVNTKETRQGHTALMWAVAQKHPEVVRTLIEQGADVRARTKGGFTPLLFAAQQGDMDSARMLLGAGAKVNDATPDGDTPLLVASASGHEALSIFLLDKGADPNAADRNGITALHYAVMSGLAEITGTTAMIHSFVPYVHRPNMVELVKALLAHGANPNAQLVSPTVPNDSGPGYGKIFRIDHLDMGGGRVSPVGATPFLMAALSHDAGLMRILAAGGADPLLATQENITPLMAAAGLGRQRDRLLSTEEQSRALEAVKVAVELGANVNAVDNLTGLTALHGAAFFGSDSIIQFLAENGANLDAKDKAGQTPLDKAANIRPKGAVERNLYPSTYWKSTVDLLLKLGSHPSERSLAKGSDGGAGL